MELPLFKTTATEKIKRLEAELRVEKRRIAEMEQKWINAEDESQPKEMELQNEIVKQALFKVGKEINEETRMSKNAKQFAVAIVLNALADIDGWTDF